MFWLSLYLLLLSLKNKWFFIGAGVVTGLAIMTKYPAVLVVMIGVGQAEATIIDFEGLGFGDGDPVPDILGVRFHADIAVVDSVLGRDSVDEEDVLAGFQDS